MKDLSVLRNELFSMSFICSSKKNSFRFNHYHKDEFDLWVRNNIDEWKLYLSDYESEEEFIFYLLRPNIIKGQIFCENCGKLLSFSRIKNKNKTCCIECQIARMHSPERNAKFSETWNNKSEEELTDWRNKMEDTMLNRYGVKHNWCNGELREKEKETWVEKYGVDHPLKSGEIRERIKKTKKERYGDEFYTNRGKANETMTEKYGGFYNNPENISITWNNKSKEELLEISKKTKRTNLQRYGTETPWYSEEGRQKSKETCLKKYGVEHWSNTDDVKNKKAKTVLKHFGVDVPFKSELVKEKSRNTIMKKYGVDCIQKSSEFQSSIRHRYRYDNVFFDSKYELYFYIYHKVIMKNDIQRGIRFPYEYNGEINYYFCDFLLNNENIEIKGNHMFRDGKLYFPYKNSENWQEKQNKWDAKSKCMKQNKVRVVLTESDEMKKVVSKVNEVFGKDYVKSFDVKSLKENSNQLFEE